LLLNRNKKFRSALPGDDFGHVDRFRLSVVELLRYRIWSLKSVTIYMIIIYIIIYPIFLNQNRKFCLRSVLPGDDFDNIGRFT